MRGHVGLAVFLLALAAVPLVAPQFYITLGNYIGLYSMVALGLVLLTGVAGQTSFGQAAFVGLGAYTSAYLTTKFGMSPWFTLFIGIAITMLVALFLGFITLRMKGHYLPLATIAWGISLYYVFGNLEMLGGHTGMTGIPALSIAGLELKDERRYFYLIWVLVLAALWATHNILDSRPGRAIRALKGGLDMVEAFGVDAARLKIIVFVYAALLACISGWLYAHLQRFVNPTPFGINQGIEYLFMAVVGGAGSVWGAVLGATLITLLKQVLQDMLPGLLGRQGNFELVVFGILMVLLLQFARDGVWPWIARLLPRRAPAPVPDAPPLPARERAPASGTLLRVDKARKQFGGLVAVHDLSFEIREREILGLIGPNGAGKSTTFALISGALPLTSGQVLLRGTSIGSRPPYEIARLGIGRTFQHVKLIPGMTVLDNVAIGAYLRGASGVVQAALKLDRAEEARTKAEAARAIARVGLGDHMFDTAGSLALGQQRIVEIARALASDPALLLLDEPAAGLRYLEKQELARLLRALKGEGMTILLVEHDMDFVMGLTDRLVVMDFGEKLAEGAPAEIQRDPSVREAYLGERGVSALLEVRDICVAYGKVEAVHKVSLRVEEGSIVSVIGPNGAGKTTLLGAIMGTLPARGTVTYAGRAIDRLTVEQRVAGGLVLVPEKRDLFGSMKVEDNLELGAFTRVRRVRDAVRALDDVYARFPRLRERRLQDAGTLSGGERQMLALGRALMARPRLLMLDEPSLGLAPLIVREIFSIVTELKATGVSILLIEQNARAALQVSDYGYVLETGECAVEGPSSELAANPRVAATYLGAAAAQV